MVRKYSREPVANLRIRLQECSVNVDDNKRLINRLVAALSELLGYKSVSNIRHTCAILSKFYSDVNNFSMIFFPQCICSCS